MSALFGIDPLLKMLPFLHSWRFVIPEAKALTHPTEFSALVVLLMALVFRALVPWVLVALVSCWLWKAATK